MTPYRLMIIYVAIVITACFLLPGLDVNLLAKERSASLGVSFSFANSSPDVVEGVTSVIENACSQLRQLKHINSTSGYNGGSVQLYFDQSTNMAYKKLELAALIRRLYRQLPAGVSFPYISGGNTTDTESPVLVYSINAQLQPHIIREECEMIFRKALSNLTGIKELVVSGTENLQLVIQFDRNKCNAWHTDPDNIMPSLNSFFSNTYPGYITKLNHEQYFLQVPAPKASIPLIESIVIPSDRNTHLLLKDIATVYFQEARARSFFRINGKNVVRLSIYAMNDVNKVIVANNVKRVVKAASKLLPKGFELNLEYDDTLFFKEEMSKNYRRLLLSISMLFVLIMVAYRDWRYLLNLFAGLIMTLSLTIVMARLFCVPIHLYTIGGIAAAFNIAIDNTIVMLDYYKRRRDRRIFMAMGGASLITITSLYLVSRFLEHEQTSVRDFSIILIVSLLGSLVTLLCFTPAFYELLHIRKRDTGLPVGGGNDLRSKRLVSRIYEKTIQILVRHRKICILALLLLFGTPIFMLPEQWKGDKWYHRWYNNTVGSAYYQEKIRPKTDKWLGGTLRLFVENVFDKGGVRDLRKTKLYVQAELPSGNTPDQMNLILKDFERYLAGVAGLDKVITNVYSGQYGLIEMSFTEDAGNTSLPYQLKARLIARSLNWGGVEWDIYGIGQGFSNTGDEETPNFAVTMKGYNYDELERQAKLLAAKLKERKRVRKVNIDERLNYNERTSREYILLLDAGKLAISRVNKASVLHALRTSSEPGQPAGQIIINNKYYPVFIKEKTAGVFSNFDLMFASQMIDSNNVIRINNVGSLSFKQTMNSIYKEGRQYIRVVSFEYLGLAEIGRAFLETKLVQMEREMPVGYTAEVRTNAGPWDWDSQNKFLLIALLLVAVYFITSIIFESLKKPFFIVAIIPVSFIGLFLIFNYGHFYFDQGGYAAFILLGSLVASAAIFIVNDLNMIMKGSGGEINNVLLHVIRLRSRTILVTTCAACFSMVPFLMEGRSNVFWFSFAVGTVGGLLFSLFSIFIVLPVLLWKKNNKA